MKIAGIIFWASLIIAVLGGWIANIVKLVSYTGEWGIMQLCRCVGIIAAPLGVVLGYVS